MEASIPHLKLLWNRKIVGAFIKDKKYRKLKIKEVEVFMKENELSSAEMQALLDDAGISNRGYTTIYKCLQLKMKQSSVSFQCCQIHHH